MVLLDNAFKFTEEEGTVRVFVDWDETCNARARTGYRLRHRQKDLPYVFDRFYKAEKSHSAAASGLGLSIASEIMSLMGEKIWVQSVVGEGRPSPLRCIARSMRRAPAEQPPEEGNGPTPKGEPQAKRRRNAVKRETAPESRDSGALQNAQGRRSGTVRFERARLQPCNGIVNGVAQIRGR